MFFFLDFEFPSDSKFSKMNRGHTVTKVSETTLSKRIIKNITIKQLKKCQSTPCQTKND